MSTSTAVEKAKREGIKKKFYITSPSGQELAATLPGVDMAARLVTEMFVEEIIGLEDYRLRKDTIYEYIHVIDEWISDMLDLLLQQDEKIDLRPFRNYVKWSRDIYFNTQTGIDAYRTFVKCDKVHRLLVIGLKTEMISADVYSRSTAALSPVLHNFAEEIEGIKAFVWRCRESSGRRRLSRKEYRMRLSSI